MYQPHKFTHWTLGLDKVPGWQDEVRQQLSHPVAWAKKWRKPLLMSEFGAWVPPCHSVEDYRTYIRFVADECRKHHIGWMYYCCCFNNQWAFNILHTEDGWNQDALDILTGVTAPPVPPLSPLLNTEFSTGTVHWTGEGSVTLSVARGAGLSGPTALKVEATKSDRAAVYQQTPKSKVSPPGRYLISVRKGRLYRLSFLARAAGDAGTVKVRLADASGSGDGFWTSQPLAISNVKAEYTVEYRHTGTDVNDVRLAFLFGDKDQTILLDRVALRGYRSAVGQHVEQPTSALPANGHRGDSDSRMIPNPGFEESEKAPARWVPTRWRSSWALAPGTGGRGRCLRLEGSGWPAPASVPSASASHPAEPRRCYSTEHSGPDSFLRASALGPRQPRRPK